MTGAAEGLGFILRLATGPAVDRMRRYWGFTIVGYVITAVCVPLLAVTPFLGTLGLSVAATLIILERTGKAIRSPAKTAVLAYAASAVGRGRGFGVHKMMDQIGVFAGPLVVVGMIALTGALWPAFAVLALPAIAAMGMLALLRLRVPDPSIYERAAAPPAPDATQAAANRPGERHAPPSSCSPPRLGSRRLGWWASASSRST
ncbi:MAG: hypothetical protein ACOH10_02750 [Rhodoglobus sp.]